VALNKKSLLAMIKFYMMALFMNNAALRQALHVGCRNKFGMTDLFYFFRTPMVTIPAKTKLFFFGQ
jgi:hypothetical protein